MGYAAICALLGITAEPPASCKSNEVETSLPLACDVGAQSDSLPGQDPGWNLLLAARLMLLQTIDTILLLPAWPRNLDVSFKLHARHHHRRRTTVMANRTIDRHARIAP